MIDYSNKEVMKEVMDEAKQAGIFAVGKDKKLIKEIYWIKVNDENSFRLDLILNENLVSGASIKKQDRTKFKLVQMDFDYGRSNLIKSKKFIIKRFLSSYLKRERYLIEIYSIKDKSSRAWDSVNGNLKSLYFKGSDGFITIINIKKSKNIKNG